MCLIVQPNKQNNSHTHCRLRVQSLFRIGGFINTFFSFQQYQIQTVFLITIFIVIQNLHAPKNFFQHFSFKTNYSLKKTLSSLVRLDFLGIWEICEPYILQFAFSKKIYIVSYCSGYDQHLRKVYYKWMKLILQ